MKRYYRSLVHYGTKFTNDIASIEDCLQDLFAGLWRRRASLPTPPSVKHYLFKSHRNHLFTALQKSSGRQAESLLADIPAEELTAEELLIHEETSLATHYKLHNTLSALSARQREAVHLKYYENLSYDQIAYVMNINRQSVANLLQQAIRKMRALWQLIGLLLLLQ